MYDLYQILRLLALIAIIMAGFSYLFATAFTIGTG